MEWPTHPPLVGGGGVSHILLMWLSLLCVFNLLGPELNLELHS